MVLASERTKLLAAQPLGRFAGVGALGEGHVHRVGRHREHGDVEKSNGVCPAEQKSHKQAAPTEQAETFDGVVLLDVLGALRQRCVDDMAVVRLQTDVQETKHGEELVNERIAPCILQVVGDDPVLAALEELHGEEEEHCAWQVQVQSGQFAG